MVDLPDRLRSFPAEPALRRRRARAVILVLAEVGYGLVMVLGGAALAALVYGFYGSVLGVPFGLPILVAAGLLLALVGLVGGLLRGLIGLGRSLRRTIPIITRHESL